MKKLKLIFILLFITIFVMGAKISDNILRVGPKTGSDIDIQMGAGVVRFNNATGKIETSDDGIGFNAISDIGANTSQLIENATVSTSVASSALTIDLTIADGSTDPSGGSSVSLAFRDVTVTDGAYNILSLAAATTIVVPSGATLNHQDTVDGFIYVYLLDNAGTLELAVSSEIKDESSVQTSVTIDGTSDDGGLYSTTGRSNVPIRLFARLKSNQTTAGTWDLDVTENSPGLHIFTDITNNLSRKTENNSTTEIMTIYSAQMEYAAGTPSITEEHGNWLDSVTDSGVGFMTLTITAGIFSADPHCSCLTNNFDICAAHIGTFATTTSFQIRMVTNSGSAVDSNANVTCFGPK